MYGKLNNNNSIDFGIKNNLANSWFAFGSDTIFFHSWASKWLRNTSLNVAAFVSSRSGTLHKIISDYNSLTGIGIKTSRWNFRYSAQLWFCLIQSHPAKAATSVWFMSETFKLSKWADFPEKRSLIYSLYSLFATSTCKLNLKWTRSLVSAVWPDKNC